MLTESNLMILLSLSNSLFFSISARDLEYITIYNDQQKFYFKALDLKENTLKITALSEIRAKILHQLMNL